VLRRMFGHKESAWKAVWTYEGECLEGCLAIRVLRRMFGHKKESA
jgi:hypothetical protein